MRGQLTGIVRRDILQHGFPYLSLHVGGGLLELHLEEEAALEGTVEVARQVGGGDEDAFEVFQFLEDDVLAWIKEYIYLCLISSLGKWSDNKNNNTEFVGLW